MPRNARIKSETQIYHIMLRGNERKDIFLDDEDKQRFIYTLIKKKESKGFFLYAYCIMDNHVHIIIKEQTDAVEKVIKRVATSYAYYYNKKHKRVGHVFQDRYKSEAVDDDSYLLAAIRYVHNNPYKAFGCLAGDYKYSSYPIYLEGENIPVAMEELKDVLGMFSKDLKHAVKLYREFSMQEDGDTFIEIDEAKESQMHTDEALEYFDNTLKKMEF